MFYPPPASYCFLDSQASKERELAILVPLSFSCSVTIKWFNAKGRGGKGSVLGTRDKEEGECSEESHESKRTQY